MLPSVLFPERVVGKNPPIYFLGTNQLLSLQVTAFYEFLSTFHYFISSERYFLRLGEDDDAPQLVPVATDDSRLCLSASVQAGRRTTYRARIRGPTPAEVRSRVREALVTGENDGTLLVAVPVESEAALRAAFPGAADGERVTRAEWGRPLRVMPAHMGRFAGSVFRMNLRRVLRTMGWGDLEREEDIIDAVDGDVHVAVRVAIYCTCELIQPGKAAALRDRMCVFDASVAVPPCNMAAGDAVPEWGAALSTLGPEDVAADPTRKSDICKTLVDLGFVPFPFGESFGELEKKNVGGVKSSSFKYDAIKAHKSLVYMAAPFFRSDTPIIHGFALFCSHPRWTTSNGGAPLDDATVLISGDAFRMRLSSACRAGSRPSTGRVTYDTMLRGLSREGRPHISKVETKLSDDAGNEVLTTNMFGVQAMETQNAYPWLGFRSSETCFYPFGRPSARTMVEVYGPKRRADEDAAHKKYVVPSTPDMRVRASGFARAAFRPRLPPAEGRATPPPHPVVRSEAEARAVAAARADFRRCLVAPGCGEEVVRLLAPEDTVAWTDGDHHRVFRAPDGWVLVEMYPSHNPGRVPPLTPLRGVAEDAASWWVAPRASLLAAARQGGGFWEMHTVRNCLAPPALPTPDLWSCPEAEACVALDGLAGAVLGRPPSEWEAYREWRDAHNRRLVAERFEELLARHIPVTENPDVQSLSTAARAVVSRLAGPTKSSSSMAWFTTTSELADACDILGQFCVLSAILTPEVSPRGFDSLASGELTPDAAAHVQALVDFVWMHRAVTETPAFVGHLNCPEGRAFSAAHNAAVAFATNDPAELRPQCVWEVHLADGRLSALRAVAKPEPLKKRADTGSDCSERLAIEEHATAARALRLHLMSKPDSGVLHNMGGGTRLDLRVLQNLPARIKPPAAPRTGKRAHADDGVDLAAVGDLRPVKGFHPTPMALQVTVHVDGERMFGPLDLYSMVHENQHTGLMTPYMVGSHHVYYSTVGEVHTFARAQLEAATQVRMRCTSLFKNGTTAGGVEVCGKDYAVRFASRNIHLKLIMRDTSNGRAQLHAVALLLKKDATLKQPKVARLVSE